MCRYAFKDYKSHFACFPCRKSFKKAPIRDFFAQRGRDLAYDRLSRIHQPTEPQRYQRVVTEFGTDLPTMQAEYLEAVSVCPQCGGEMAAMGLDFRAPPMDDGEAWTIVHALYEHGFAFFGCGCSVNYRPPERRSGLPEFLRTHSKQTDGERLLATIASRLQTSGHR